MVYASMVLSRTPALQRMLVLCLCRRWWRPKIDSQLIFKLYTLTVDMLRLDKSLWYEYWKLHHTSNILERTILKDRLPTRSLMLEFARLECLNCLKLSDKISICLNMSNLRLAFIGEVFTKDQYRWLLLTLGLASGDMNALCGDMPKVSISQSKHSWLSWVYEEETISSTASNPDISSIALWKLEELIIDSFYLGACIFRTPTPKSLEICEESLRRFIKEVAEHHISLLPCYNSEHPNYLSQLAIVTEMMAHSLHCGLEWMSSQLTIEELWRNKRTDHIEN